MTTYLWLLRHGRATGQGNAAPLLPEGEKDIAELGRRFAREKHRPVKAFCSPLQRARDTAAIFIGELGVTLPVVVVPKLQPESLPKDSLEALFALGIPDGRVLVVSHLPLIAHLTLGLTGETVDFQPGTLAEIEMDHQKLGGEITRILRPGDPES